MRFEFKIVSFENDNHYRNLNFGFFSIFQLAAQINWQSYETAQLSVLIKGFIPHSAIHLPLRTASSTCHRFLDSHHLIRSPSIKWSFVVE
jgi:hypothetical protein